MPSYDTMVEALNGLKARGFTTDFNLAFDSVRCAATGVCLRAEEFEIIEHYRFEGATNPSDSSVVYGIASKDGNMKGVLVNAYGVYSEPASDDMIRKLSVHETPGN
ncbi:phosphoribosylpyrophosphate synthetase [Sediminibacterium soli]|uniref:phosphoribosylpyrophosphate synthetase n=1 Tax=Sediminibacterium soli TaxID=2698829 RepID=UPI00137B282C|nr:phosphoribosylpyrophosphate synthetase [Sediminibacterium soli]NCI46328.1 phosphoribosylpyrophosphate synthetase [Sediminibacterium soli]